MHHVLQPISPVKGMNAITKPTLTYVEPDPGENDSENTRCFAMKREYFARSSRIFSSRTIRCTCDVTRLALVGVATSRFTACMLLAKLQLREREYIRGTRSERGYVARQQSLTVYTGLFYHNNKTNSHINNHITSAASSLHGKYNSNRSIYSYLIWS